MPPSTAPVHTHVHTPVRTPAHRLRTVVPALLALVLALALAPTGPASAESGSRKDPSKDLWYSDGGAYQGYGDKTTRNADLTRLQVAHTRHRVQVVAHYTNLAPVGSDRVLLISRFKTSESKQFYANTVLSGGTLKTYFYRYYPGKDKSVEKACPSMSDAARYRQDVMVVSFRRSCISKPRWIRWELQNALGRAMKDGSTRQFRDNGMNNQAFFADDFSRRLDRG